MKKYILLGILICSGLISITAQEYNTGIGLRGGISNGITVKHFISENTAIEGILDTRWKGFILTGLYEFENPAFNTIGLSWYYGFGGHIGSWAENNNNPPSWWENNHEGGYVIIGADGIIGIEYTFDMIPINVSLDWKPGINFIGHTGLWADMTAFSIRYVF